MSLNESWNHQYRGPFIAINARGALADLDLDQRNAASMLDGCGRR